MVPKSAVALATLGTPIICKMFVMLCIVWTMQLQEEKTEQINSVKQRWREVPEEGVSRGWND